MLLEQFRSPMIALLLAFSTLVFAELLRAFAARLTKKGTGLDKKCQSDARWRRLPTPVREALSL